MIQPRILFLTLGLTFTRLNDNIKQLEPVLLLVQTHLVLRLHRGLLCLIKKGLLRTQRGHHRGPSLVSSWDIDGNVTRRLAKDGGI